MKFRYLVALIFLALPGKVASQNPVDAISKQFEEWQKMFPQVRVFASFNQNKYAPGDTAFFKTYFFTEQLARVGGRQILHLALINDSGQEVGHSNFGVKDGVGSNQFLIPDSIRAGFYRFTLFSDWMRNFNPSLYFQQEVEVVKKNKILPKMPENTITFFPEGGSLIAGVSNKIVMVAEGLSNLSGDLVDAHDRQVTSFQINQHGLGSVIFIPQPGMKYTVRIKGQQYEMPLPENDGLALLLTSRSDRSPVRVLISAPAGSTLRKENLMVMLTVQGEIFYAATFQLAGKDFVQAVIPQQELPSGVAQLSVLSEEGRTLATRLFAVQRTSKAIASLTFKSREVAARERISVDLELTDGTGKPLAGEFSVSAVNEKLFDTDSLVNFADQLTLYSELGSSALPIDTSQPEGFRTLDQWLITRKSYRIDWGRVRSEHTGEVEYRMNTYLNKKGRAFYKRTGEPVPDSTMIMVYLQKHTTGYQCYTTRNGDFELPFLFDFWGVEEIFYQAELRGEDLHGVKAEWLPENLTAAPARSSRQVEQQDEYSVFVRKKKLIDHSYYFYSKAAGELKPEQAGPNAELEDELMGADITVNVQDYILFPTMIEVLREIVPALQHRKAKGKPVVRVMLSDEGVFTNGDPLYIIDGVMTRDTEYFLNLSPSNVLTIKVVRTLSKLRHLGEIGKNGVVFVQTKKPDLQKLTAGNTVLSVRGLERSQLFKAADHSKDSDSRIPDFRSTLLWAPSVPVNSSGKGNFSFFASDDTGPVAIRIQGMTSDGRPFSAFARVHVRYPQ